MPNCDQCGLSHDGNGLDSCQKAARAHYEERIGGLWAALVKYGQHTYFCEKRFFEIHADVPCTCGLDQALEGE